MGNAGRHCCLRGRFSTTPLGTRTTSIAHPGLLEGKQAGLAIDRCDLAAMQFYLR